MLNYAEKWLLNIFQRLEANAKQAATVQAIEELDLPTTILLVSGNQKIEMPLAGDTLERVLAALEFRIAAEKLAILEDEAKWSRELTLLVKQDSEQASKKVEMLLNNL